MKDILIKKLQDFLIDNHPDLLLILAQEGKEIPYLQEVVAIVDELSEQLLREGKPIYIIEEMCLQAFINDFGSSKFNYLLSILKEEFKIDYYRFKQNGLLTYEVINIIYACKTVFEEFGFTAESETDRYLKYAIIAEIQEYLESK